MAKPKLLFWGVCISWGTFMAHGQHFEEFVGKISLPVFKGTQ